jgi:hypothetical protein
MYILCHKHRQLGLLFEQMLRLVAKQLMTLRSCSRQAHPHLFAKYPNLNNWLRLLGITSTTDTATIAARQQQQQTSNVDSAEAKTTINFHDMYERVVKSNSSDAAAAELLAFCASKPFSFSHAEVRLLADSFRALQKCCKFSSTHCDKLTAKEI